jgi:hypothetical protein
MRRRLALLIVALISTPLAAAVMPRPQTAQINNKDSSNPVGPSPALSALSAALGFQSASSALRGEWTADTRNTWRDNDGEPRVQFNLRTGAGDSRWGFGVRLRDLAGLPSAAVANMANDVQFSWTREAGTFRFNGSFDAGRGSGTYMFTPDQTFITNMAALGYKNLAADDVVRFAVIDVTTAHVRGLAQAGYPGLSIDDVARTRIHRVTPEFVRDLAGLGYKNIAVEELVRFRIHKVTPEFIKALEARGYRNLAGEDLVKMRIHKVSPEEIDQLTALGFGGMNVDDLVKFRIHKVTPDFIRSMKEIGFQSITERQLVNLRIHKVDAQFIRHAREDGLSIQTPGDAVDLAIHGPRWRRRGF